MRFWRKRRPLFSAILLGALLLCVWSAMDLRLSSDITEALPNGKEFESLQRLLDSNASKDRLFVSLNNGQDHGFAQLDSLLRQLQAAGTVAPDDALLGIDQGRRLQLLPSMFLPSELDSLKARMERADAGRIVREGINDLATPEGWGGVPFTQDPLGLMEMVDQRGEYAAAISPFGISPDGVFLENGAPVWVFRFLAPERKEQILETLAAFRRLRVELLQHDQELVFFSPRLLEAANISQIKIDLRWTMLIATVLILVLLVWTYRSLITPLLFVLPGAFGFLLAVATMQWLHGGMLGIALGAGSVVFGIVMDHAFHFFTHYRHTGSMEGALRDVSTPMATSCSTTVLAFALLTLTDAPLLQQIGLFAALSLVGSVLSVLFVLPVFLPAATKQVKPAKAWSVSWPRWFTPVGALVIVALTIFFFGRLDQAEFNADLDDLNFTTQQLEDAEQVFSGLVPGKEKRLFLEMDEATAEQVEQAYIALRALYEEGLAKGFVLRELDHPGKKLEEKRIWAWQQVWGAGHQQLIDALEQAGASAGMRSGAFKSLAEWGQGPVERSDATLMPGQLVANKADLAIIKERLASLEGLVVTDPRSGSMGMVQAVQDNFNFILVGSSCLVLITLLIIYGRLELTLITFLPMAISWIWIVGASSLLGIKFNFVNIILSTFIFGLGDDFAIFISSSHLDKYKTGRDHLATDRLAIKLSAISTLIGMVALRFAEHPAIRSISDLSIFGILIILFMSLFLQPLLFKWIITGRAKKGLQPFTLLNFLFSVYVFTLFGSLCLLAFCLQLVLIVLPFPKAKKRWLLRKVLQLGCALIIDTAVTVRKRRRGLKDIDLSRPKVIVTGHQSFIDILQMVSLSPRIVIMVKKWVYQNPLFGAMVRYAGYLYVDHSPEVNQERIKARLDEGCSIMVFPEGTRSAEGEFRRWHKGAFYIAEQNGLEVQPILLHGYGHTMAKNDIQLANGVISCVALPTESPDGDLFSEGYSKAGKRAAANYKAAYWAWHRDHAGIDYQYKRLLAGFLYKGPVVEWYFRVKWRLEREVLDKVDHLLPADGHLLDLGCGMGFNALYLQERSNMRSITAVDYDQEKIDLAANHYLTKEGLRFIAADIREFELPECDGILLGDVLHYLAPAERKALLERCLGALRSNGVILVREGFNSDTDAHERTRSTERWSTRILRFNKAAEQLHFMDVEEIEQFTRKNELLMKVEHRSQRTSNALISLRKA